MVNRFTDIMKQSGTFCHADIRSDFSCKKSGKLCYFNGMFEPVRHRMDKARALHYVRQLNRYHMAGFETIFHPENFR